MIRLRFDLMSSSRRTQQRSPTGTQSQERYELGTSRTAVPQAMVADRRRRDTSRISYLVSDSTATRANCNFGPQAPAS